MTYTEIIIISDSDQNVYLRAIQGPELQTSVPVGDPGQLDPPTQLRLRIRVPPGPQEAEHPPQSPHWPQTEI